MSSKTVITCDHCGKEVPNVYDKRFSFMACNAAAELGTIDACSKEHLSLAMAKILGIPVDATTVSIVKESNNRLEMARQATIERDEARKQVYELEKACTDHRDAHDAARNELRSHGTKPKNLPGAIAFLENKITELEAHTSTLTTLANQYKAERDSLEETCRMHSARVIELEKQRDSSFAETEVERLKDKADNLLFDKLRAVERITELEKQLTAANASREPKTIQDHADTYQASYAEMAYEAWQNLPATPKETKLWGMLKVHERNEWRAIVEPVVERVRAEKGRGAMVADKQTVERIAAIIGENGGESLNSAEMERIARAVIASITDTTKPTKPIADHVHELGSCTFCDANTSGKKATLEVCEHCIGRGRIIDLFLKTEKPCEFCNGFGKVIQ